MLESAVALAGLGYRIVPIHPLGSIPGTSDGKFPWLSGWQHKASGDASLIRQWWSKRPDSGIGVVTGGGMFCFDIDTKSGGLETFEELVRVHGNFPETVSQQTGGGGFHYFFRASFPVRNATGLLPGIDIRGEGGQCVVAPSPHASGESYRWIASPFDVEIASAPEWLISLLQSSSGPKRVLSSDETVPLGERHSALISRAGRLINSGYHGKELYAMLQGFNKLMCDPPEEDEVILRLAADAESRWFEPSRAKPQDHRVLESKGHLSVARYLLEEMTSELGARPVHDLGSFHIYRRECGYYVSIGDETVRKWVHRLEGRWYVSGEEIERNDAGKIVKDANGKSKKKKTHSQIQCSFSFVNGVFNCIRTESSVEGFFGSPALGMTLKNGFLTPEGTLVNHCPDQRSLSQVPINFVLGSEHPRLTKCLNEIFADDPSKADLIQEYVGAAMMGMVTPYQKCLVFNGEGRNGKSTVIDIMETVFHVNDISCVLPQQFKTPYYVAHLAGKKINMVPDAPGAEIDKTGTFKAVISGDRVIGRHPMGRPFAFRPVAGHVFSCNELPPTRDMTVGFFRRFCVLSFTAEFKGQDAVLDIGKRIVMAESEGILAWAVAGAMRLKKNGRLTMPSDAQKAVDEWRHNADQVLQYIDERTDKGKEQAKALYDDYKKWAYDHGHSTLSSVKFFQRLKRAGHEPTDWSGKKMYPLSIKSQKSMYRQSQEVN